MGQFVQVKGIPTQTLAVVIPVYYTLFDESGTAQNFDIVPLSTHRQTYRQTDTLQHPRILISSHSGCPTLVKERVMLKELVMKNRC